MPVQSLSRGQGGRSRAIGLAVKLDLGAFETPTSRPTWTPQSRWIPVHCCPAGAAARLEPSRCPRTHRMAVLTTGPRPSDNGCGARSRVGRWVIREEPNRQSKYRTRRAPFPASTPPGEWGYGARVGRALGFVASFISVVAGCLALVRWLDSQDISLVAIAVVILGISVVLLVIRSRAMAEFAQAPPIIYVSAASGAFVTALSDIDDTATRDRLTFLFATGMFVFTAGPLAKDLYEKDKLSRKSCDDCCETVKADARVCRHCGYEFWAKGATAPVNGPGDG